MFGVNTDPEPEPSQPFSPAFFSVPFDQSRRLHVYLTPDEMAAAAAAEADAARERSCCPGARKRAIAVAIVYIIFILCGFALSLSTFTAGSLAITRDLKLLRIDVAFNTHPDAIAQDGTTANSIVDRTYGRHDAAQGIGVNNLGLPTVTTNDTSATSASSIQRPEACERKDVPDFYNIYLWSVCGGIRPNEYDTITCCVKSRYSINYNRGHAILNIMSQGLDELGQLETTTGAQFLYVTYVVGLIIGAVALVFEIALFCVPQHRYVSRFRLFLFSMSFMFLLMATAYCTSLANRLAAEINTAGEDFGISARVGQYWINIAWGGTTFMLVVALFIGCLKCYSRKRRATSEEKPQPVEQAPLTHTHPPVAAVPQYVPWSAQVAGRT